MPGTTHRLQALFGQEGPTEKREHLACFQEGVSHLGSSSRLSVAGMHRKLARTTLQGQSLLAARIEESVPYLADRRSTALLSFIQIYTHRFTDTYRFLGPRPEVLIL